MPYLAGGGAFETLCAEKSRKISITLYGLGGASSALAAPTVARPTVESGPTAARGPHRFRSRGFSMNRIFPPQFLDSDSNARISR